MAGKEDSSVLFDLDGTLTDPGEGFVACVSHALSKLGCRRYADGEIRRHVGPPLEETLARLLEDPSMIPAAVTYYRERYASLGYLENVVYPGIEDALRTLQAAGMRLFVATSKPTAYAERILAHFGLDRFFEAIYGSEFDGTRSNKIELLAYLLDRETIADAAMVGDRAHDVAAALAHRLYPVGALWGYGSREELATAGAAALCERPADLPAILTRR